MSQPDVFGRSHPPVLSEPSSTGGSGNPWDQKPIPVDMPAQFRAVNVEAATRSSDLDISKFGPGDPCAMQEGIGWDYG